MKLAGEDFFVLPAGGQVWKVGTGKGWLIFKTKDLQTYRLAGH